MSLQCLHPPEPLLHQQEGTAPPLPGEFSSVMFSFAICLHTTG